MIGQRLLHYEIVEKLGAGGMGVVYKARDTHLDRFVALKVLPPEKITDPARKARFIQEAKAASALNHPNIVTIHDIASDQDTDFIAMEYVAGKTLEQLIPRKGLRLGEALKVAIQIADALARAHAASIVHRDLKPANIMVDTHGHVRVLDFGLAKLTEIAPISADESTRTLKPTTGEGTIVGTAAYMSPEQAEGKPVDARSDIFSFGSVLYEMVTGQRAFQGESSMATLGAVIQQEPVPLPPDVPHDLAKVIFRSLRKDPGRRFQHMDDVKVALEELKEESDSGSLAGAQEKTARGKLAWLPWVAALAALLLIAAAWFAWQRAHPPAPAPRVLALTTYPGKEEYPALSPDGRHVAFSWNGEKQDNADIYVQVVGSGAPPVRLTSNPAPDRAPAWSPDGTQIAFVRTQGTKAAVYVTPALVGQERKVADFRAPRSLFGLMGPAVSWSPDGKWLAVPQSLGSQTTEITLFPVERGEARTLISNPITEGRFYWPVFSSKGDSLAYSLCFGRRDCDVHVLELGAGYVPKGSPRRITRRGATIEGIAWAPDGRSLIYAASSDLLAPFFLWRVSLAGDVEPERMELAGERGSNPTFSRTGARLAFSRSDVDADIWKFEGGAPPQRFVSSTRGELEPQFSPDGQRVAFSSARSGLGSELCVANRDGTNLICLTKGWDGLLCAPRWSPDGRWITFQAHKAYVGWEAFVIDSAGGQPRRLTPEKSNVSKPSWSRDGKWIYFGSDRTGRYEVYRVPCEGGETTQVTRGGGQESTESADGKILYFRRYPRLMAMELTSGEERQILEIVEDNGWAVFDDGIYYLARREGSAGFEVRFLNFATNKSEVRCQSDLVLSGLTVSPDRKTILVVASATNGADLVLVENFH